MDAFDVTAIILRYGPMVLRRCRQLLRDEEEVLDPRRRPSAVSLFASERERAMIRSGNLFLSCSLLVVAVAAGGWTPAPAAHAGPDATPRLSLPAPTGPHRVGTTSLHLVDDSRTDQLAPTPRVRELMVRLWYPAAQSRQPAAAYLTPGVASVSVDFLRAVTGVDLPTDLLRTESGCGGHAGAQDWRMWAIGESLSGMISEVRPMDTAAECPPK
jgi:hypothetical protein